jgi:quercetin dioxygenase-like cupin family protein
MPVIEHHTIPEIQMRPGIRGQFLAHKALGASGVSLLTNTVEPGAAAPLHLHTVEETMLVLEGTVWVRVGEEHYTVGPNHTVIIPAQTPHAWGNAGATVAKLLWAFAGPDPFSDATYLEGTPPQHRLGSAGHAPAKSR